MTYKQSFRFWVTKSVHIVGVAILDLREGFLRLLLRVPCDLVLNLEMRHEKQMGFIKLQCRSSRQITELTGAARRILPVTGVRGRAATMVKRVGIL